MMWGKSIKTKILLLLKVRTRGYAPVVIPVTTSLSNLMLSRPAVTCFPPTRRPRRDRNVRLFSCCRLLAAYDLTVPDVVSSGAVKSVYFAS